VSWICMEFVGFHFDLFCLVGLIPYFTIPHDFGNASSFFYFLGIKFNFLNSFWFCIIIKR
jgi:hypothetical protein